MAARLERLERELREQRPGWRDAARALLCLALVDLARLLPGKARATAASPLALEALEVIDRRYAEPISLREVAAAVGRSPSHLTAAVRRHSDARRRPPAVDQRREPPPPEAARARPAQTSSHSLRTASAARRSAGVPSKTTRPRPIT